MINGQWSMEQRQRVLSYVCDNPNRHRSCSAATRSERPFILSFSTIGNNISNVHSSHHRSLTFVDSQNIHGEKIKEKKSGAQRWLLTVVDRLRPIFFLSPAPPANSRLPLFPLTTTLTTLAPTHQPTHQPTNLPPSTHRWSPD